MDKVALLVPDLGASQLNWHLFPQINQLVEKANTDIAVLYEDLAGACLPLNCSSHMLFDAWQYSGPVVAFTLSTARKAMKMPATNPFFYVWDLEWLRAGHRPFHFFRDVYTRVEVIARTEEHKQILQDYWGAKVIGVIPDADLSKLLQLISHG